MQHKGRSPKQAKGQTTREATKSFPFAFSFSSTSRGAWLNRQHPQSLHNRAEANEYHEQLQQLCQSSVGGELVDSPKADCTDNDDDQNPDQN
jgi:hypothetical protein